MRSRLICAPGPVFSPRRQRDLEVSTAQGPGGHQATPGSTTRRPALREDPLRSERILTLRCLNGDPAQFTKCLNSSAAAKTSPTTTLHSTERHLRLVMYRRAIDMADARLYAPGDAPSLRQVSREHGSAKAVWIVVRAGNRLVLSIDAYDRLHWTERFFREYPHRRRHVIDESGRHQGCVGFATTNNFCSFCDSVVY